MEQSTQEKPIELYFIRHGETEGNKNDVANSEIDIELSEKGKNQAIEEKKVYDALIKAGKITDKTPIISTIKERAIKTAQLLTGKNVDDITIDDGFAERKLGSWDGTITNHLGTELGGDFAPPNGGENFAMQQARLKPVLEKYIEKAKKEPVIIVSHNGTMRRIANLLIKGSDIVVDNAKLYCARSVDGGETWEFKKLSLENDKIIETEPEQKPKSKAILEPILRNPNYKFSLATNNNGSILTCIPTKLTTHQKDVKGIAETLGKTLIGNHHRTFDDTTTKIKFPAREISITLNPIQTEILQTFAKEKDITIPQPQMAR